MKIISKEKVKPERARTTIRPGYISSSNIRDLQLNPASDRGLRDLLRTSSDYDRVAFPDSLVAEVPQFSFDLLIAIMNRSVSN